MVQRAAKVALPLTASPLDIPPFDELLDDELLLEEVLLDDELLLEELLLDELLLDELLATSPDEVSSSPHAANIKLSIPMTSILRIIVIAPRLALATCPIYAHAA